MDYYDFVCAIDQDYRELQFRIREEWKIDGETDGEEGRDPEYPGNSAYMYGYDIGRARYIKRLAEAQRPDRKQLCRCGLLGEQDCECSPDWEDEF